MELCFRLLHRPVFLAALRPLGGTLRRGPIGALSCRHRVTEVSQAALSSVAPVFSVMRFDKDGNVTSFERKKTELYQELGLQARDLRFQHVTSITGRNNCIIIRMESLKAVVMPQVLFVLDFRGLGLEKWLLWELSPQLAGDGTLVTYSLPFEFRVIEAILQHRIESLNIQVTTVTQLDVLECLTKFYSFYSRVNVLQSRLHEVQPLILNTLESLVDPKLLSADRSQLHVLLQNSKSLSELETDIKVFKECLLKILDEEELIEELCLTKWTDPQVFEESSLGIDHAEEMELLLENYYMQAEELGNKARELKELIDDCESIIFINLDSHRNVMMRLNLQLTMGTFSLSLFGLIGVAFGMNLESTFEEDPRVFWLVTGLMFLGSGLIWRRLLSFLGRHLVPTSLPTVLLTPNMTTKQQRVLEVGDWEQMWQEGKIGFHQPRVHRMLKRHLQQVVYGRDSVRFFFPLCGKAVDMKWLADMGHSVVGVEVCDSAIKQFFQEQQVTYTEVPVSGLPDGKLYQSSDGRISLYRCSIHDLCSSITGQFGAIWDRGALVAINPSDRTRYASLIISLMEKDCRYLLDTLLYNPELHAGPPFFIPDDELHSLFGHVCDILLLETPDAYEEERHKKWGIDYLTEHVHLLTLKGR